MKAFATSVLLSMVVCAGCVGTAESGRMIGSGELVLTNNAGETVGRAFWGNLHDATTNDIQFIVMLPETDEMRSGARSWGNTSYRYCDLKIRRTGHQWKIEAYRVSHVGPRSLRITDRSEGTVRDVDLQVSRFWQVSEEGQLTPLDWVDDAVERHISDITRRHRDMLEGRGVLHPGLTSR